MVQPVTLHQGTAPHLKSEPALVPLLARESAAAAVFLFAGFWCGGLSSVAFFGIILIVSLITEIVLKSAGFSSSPKWDFTLIQQAVLLTLFLPPQTPSAYVALSAFIMSFFYRLAGGRTGMVLSPVILALGFLSLLRFEPAFLLNKLPLLPSVILFIVWIGIRFPRTRIETEKLISLFILTGMMIGLHEMPVGAALLWSAAAGEILLDSALLPLASSLRLIFRAAVLLIMMLFAAAAAPTEALLLTAFVAGVAAAGLEGRVDAGRKYGQA